MEDLLATPARLDRVVRRDRQVHLADRRRGLPPARVRFFGEALRQAGILIVSSTLVIWGLVFIIGLQCGIEGAYFDRANGAPAYAGVFAAWCDLRELVPLRVRLHDGRQGRHRDRRRARLDADLRRDRRARGDGHQRHDVPVRDAAAGGVAGAAVRLPVLDRRRLLRQLPGRRPADRGRLLGRLLPDLLAVPEPAGSLIQLDQGDGDGDGDRARRLLLRLQRERWARSGSVPPRRNRWS